MLLKPVTKMIYPPRACGQFLISLSGAIYVYYLHMSPWFYILAFITGLVWANVSLLIVQYVNDAKRYEIFCLSYIDPFLVAIWAPICSFSLWYIVFIISGMGMAMISIGGPRMLIKGLLSISLSFISIGLLMNIFTDNYHMTNTTPMIGMLSTSFGTICFAYVIAANVYLRSIRLKKTRAELAEANSDVLQINQIMKIANSSLNIDDMLTNVSRILKTSFQFDFISIQLYDENKGEFSFYALSGIDFNKYLLNAIKHIHFKSANADVFLSNLFKGDEHLYIPKVIDKELVSPLEQELYKIRPFFSMVSFPLVLDQQKNGIISFYSSSNFMTFDDKLLKKLKAYVSSLAVVINNATLFIKLRKSQNAINKKNEELADLSQKLSHYLSPQIYESIFEGYQDTKIEAKRKKLTVFFSDIAGFTDLTDRIESEVLTSMLNTYLTKMSEIAVKHGGTIDKYIGDAILIFFGDPNSKGAKLDAFDCVCMAMEMRKELENLKALWVDEGFAEELHVRMGLSTGYCNVGNFGSEYRMDYTIIGSQVNLASRIQYAANPGEILLAEETYLLVKDKTECERLAPLTLKGINHPVQTYRLLNVLEQAT